MPHWQTIALSGLALLVSVQTASAGVPMPAPALGALGLPGLAAAGLLYGAYRVVKHLRNRR